MKLHIHEMLESLSVRACVPKLLLQKNFSETIDWIFMKFHRNVP